MLSPIRLNRAVLAALVEDLQSGLGLPACIEFRMTIEFVILNMVVALTPPPMPVLLLSLSAVLLATVEFCAA